jgi:hypothetical protein
MIKVKITRYGGYVVGDGECPFNPDEFMMAFGDKILQAHGDMFEISDDEIAEAKRKFEATVLGAPIREVDDTVTQDEVLRLVQF